MLSRRSFLNLLLAGCASDALAHSPWGQYQVYRQKHLLVLSSRDDPDTYPYSKILVDALNRTVPEAKARPARAINLERVYNLLKSDQFQFALLSRSNVRMLRKAEGPFVGKEKIDLRTIYEFNDLEFVVRSDFPDELVEIVAHGIVDSLSLLPNASAAELVMKNPYLHSGALKVLR